MSQYGAFCSTSETELDTNGGSSRMRLRLENVLSSRLTRLGLLREKSKLSLVHAKISKARMQTLTEKMPMQTLTEKYLPAHMIARHTLRVLDANHSKERELLCAAA